MQQASLLTLFRRERREVDNIVFRLYKMHNSIDLASYRTNNKDET